MISRVRWVPALSLFLALSVAACSSDVVRSARRGDLPDLAAQIQARIDDGSLTRHRSAEIARAIAEREIGEARGPAGVARIGELRACARDLDDALLARERVGEGDEVAIEAAWARALYGNFDESDARAYSSSTTPRLRAIAALGLVRDDDAPARRKAFVDPLLEARRAAMRAALKVLDPDDVPGLADAARRDPDPLVRTDALRALVAIGGARVAELLRDLWTTGDDGIRGDIGVAWTRPNLFEHGGEQALRVLVATARGPGAIEAASAVANGHVGSDELRQMAVAMLLRTIASDARRGRLHALAIAPLTGPLVDAIRTASKEEDLEIKLAALSRLLELDSDRVAAIAALEPIAGGEHGRLSRKALFALASHGHMAIQAWLERDLRSADSSVRLSGLVGLVALGRAPRGAGLLADADVSVRTRAACLLLGADRKP